MGWLVLILGLAIWIGAHLWKRAAPASRARFGEPGKGIVAALLVVSILLMWWGYGRADGPVFWGRASWSVGINNLLTLVAVWLFVASNAGGRIATRMRNPQLTAVKVWAVAHLLVNGSAKAFVLFGGLLAWAVVEVIVLKRTEAWEPRAPGPWSRDFAAAAIALVFWGVIAWIHTLFGKMPVG